MARRKVNQTWGDLIASQTHFIKYVAWHLVHDNEKAEDLTQDVLLHLLGQEGKFQPGTNLKQWIRRVCYNVFVNQYRVDIRWTRADTMTDILNEGNLSTHVCYNTGEGSINIQNIESAISQLDKKSRDIILLLAKGYKYEEIADTVHVPLGTVKSSIFKSRIKLAALLGNPVASSTAFPLAETE